MRAQRAGRAAPGVEGSASALGDQLLADGGAQLREGVLNGMKQRRLRAVRVGARGPPELAVELPADAVVVGLPAVVDRLAADCSPDALDGISTADSPATGFTSTRPHHLSAVSLETVPGSDPISTLASPPIADGTAAEAVATAISPARWHHR